MIPYIITGDYFKFKQQLIKMDRLIFLNEKKTQLVYRNFKFQDDARLRKDGSRYYRCNDYKSYSCPATLSVKGDDIKSNNNHFNEIILAPFSRIQFNHHVPRKKNKITS